MQKSNRKSRLLIVILLICAFTIGTIGGLSAFLTDKAILREQLKTGTWNYSLAVDADGAKNGVWNGKKGVTLFSYQEPGTVIDIQDASAPGYTFKGWKTGDSNKGTFDSAKKKYTIAVKSSDTLTAQYTVIPYSISYDLDGGEDPGNPTTYNVETPSFTLKNPTKTGYTFLGWTGTNGTTPQTTVTVSKGSIGNSTYTAHWKPNNYIVHFDANGGIGSMEGEVYRYNESKALTANAFTRKGYTYKNWNTKKDGSGTTYTDGQTICDVVKPGEILTLYAQWNPIHYTIKYNANGVAQAQIDSLKGKNYNFDYTGAVQEFTAPANGTYKLEVWGAAGGKSTHGIAGGKGGYSSGTITLKNGEKLYVVVGGQGKANATNGGYNGGGGSATSNNDAASGGGATHIARITGTLDTLENNKNDVLIVAGGGGGAGCNNTYGGAGGGETGGAAVDPNTQYGGVGQPGTQSNGGKAGTNSQNGSFGKGGDSGTVATWTGAGGGGGWYGAGGGGNTSGGGGAAGGGSGYLSPQLTDAKTIVGSKSIPGISGNSTETGHSGNGYAKITVVSTEYSMEDTPMVYGTAKNLRKNSYEYPYYYFTGWNTKADGTGDTYSDEQSVNNLTTEPNGIVTLYAQWKPLAVLFDANQGAFDDKTKERTLTYTKTDKGIVLSPAYEVPKRLAYDFTGWNTKADGSGDSYKTEEEINDKIKSLKNRNIEKKPIHLYAQWSHIHYTIKYNANDDQSFLKNKKINFDYTGTMQKFIVPVDGTYKLEVWGAQGGNSSYHNKTGGKGGYSVGTYKATEGQILYIYVGGQGITNGGSLNIKGGWNGGGGVTNSISSDYNQQHIGTGGGATDISTVPGDVTLDQYNRYVRTEDSYKGRLIVAGGGGGAEYGDGTAGGGTQGVGSYGGTQSAAGQAYNGGISSYGTLFNGGLGYGVSTTGGHQNHAIGSCGGGGYYGGGAYEINGSTTNIHGYGGSGYIGGVTEGRTIAGDQSFTSPSGENETGHSGNGYARITILSIDQKMADTPMVYGEAKDLSKNTFVYPYFYFDGWNTKADGTGDAYADEETVNNLTTESNDIVTMYAQWKPVQIIFDANKGAFKNKSVIKTLSYMQKDGNISLNPAYEEPTWLTYDFKGWNTKADGTGTLYKTEEEIYEKIGTLENRNTVKQPIHLYAQWSHIHYTIKYNSNGALGVLKDKSYNFDYTGAVQKFTVPENGTYKLEVWGAQGGIGGAGGTAAKGGYSVGTVKLNANTTVYIYCGGEGTKGTNANGGFNGGGHARSTNSRNMGSGGGATDIRIGQDSLYARVIVAGGAGGGNDSSTSYTGGYGGGTAGNVGNGSSGNRTGKGGTQTAGGTAASDNSWGGTITAGSFGEGGGSTNAGYANGGGGGWYGGGSSSPDGGAGGGSGYVYTADTAKDYPSGCLLNSDYYLTDAKTVAGNTAFVAPSGINETGHSGNGYARITIVSAEMSDTPMVYGTAKNLRKNSYVYPYYYFTGWNTKADGTGDAYSDEQSVNNLTTESNGIVTMYAQWKPLTVIFDANQGTFDDKTKERTLTYSKTDKGMVLSPAYEEPKRLTYDFTGWNTKADGSGDSYKTEEEINGKIKSLKNRNTKKEPIHLYAQWSHIHYTIKYNANDDQNSLKNKQINFDYTGAMQKFIVPMDGTYKLEVWGAQGATSTNSALGVGGKGGYSTGTATLKAGTTLYVYVGGQGFPSGQDTLNANAQAGIANGGFNGGGASWGSDPNEPAGGGGGGTDIRIETDSLYARAIVAGGGSGGGEDSEQGGAGGGTTGQATSGTAGSQTGPSGCFGVAKNTNYDGGGAGGGWYGGSPSGAITGLPTSNSASDTSGGPGGSGYVYTSSTASNYPSGCLLNSNDYLTNASTTVGTSSMPSTSGGTETGHSGNGYARITILSIDQKMADTPMVYGTAKDLSKNTFVYPYFYFDGWNTKADGTGDAYADEETVNNLTTESNGIVTMYAQWKPVQIIFDANKGAFKNKSVIKTLSYMQKDSNISLNPTYEEPTWLTYDFKGWNTKADGTGTSYKTEEDIYKKVGTLENRNTVKEPIHLYAQWSPIHYTIRYDINGVPNLLKNKSYDFDYTGKVQTFTAPANGTYKLEVWGAQGGTGGAGGISAKGGYSVGTVKLTANTTVYIYCGGEGTRGTNAAGGFNGGGHARSTNNRNMGSGGGATDIRIGQDSLYARVIVAGGAGGGNDSSTSYYGGYGGGTTGNYGSGSYTGRGGTQTAGGAASSNYWGGTITAGSFGEGGGSTDAGYANGGGGGWYGGGSSGADGGAGGGSGYVYTADTAKDYPSGCLLNSDYYLTDAKTVAGNTTFTAPSGSNETGHSENGYAKITILSAEMDDTPMVYGTAKNLRKNTYQYTDHYFAGWNTKADGTGNAYADEQSVNNLTTESNGIVTMYAQWKLPKVTFIGNEGTFQKGEKEKTVEYSNSTTNITSSPDYEEPTRFTYDFAGWNTKADGSGTSYKTEKDFCKDLIKLAEQVPGHTPVKLYAQWSHIHYTIKYNANGAPGLLQGKTYNFNYTGAVQEFVAPKDGTYKLEVWGAQGGYRSSATYAGKGGYSVGTVTLKQGTTLYIYAGGSGNTGGTKGGFNGGGSRTTYNGGGGASDIRIGQDSLYARVIVAGGGGSDGATSRGGGAGGGTNGQDTTATNFGTGGGGGTQTGTGTAGSGTGGSFGQGGQGVYASSGYGGAGGGGWYGGSGTYPDGSGDDDKGGGGGSGYIYTASTASSYPSGCLLNSSYYLANASTTAGTASMPSTSGGTETGHSGNGYARITVVSAENGMEDTQMVYGEAKNLRKNAYKYDDHYFVGWNSKADGTGTAYTDEQSVNNLTTESNGVVTMYAQWKLPKITFVGNEGSFKEGETERTLEYTKSVTAIESNPDYEEPARHTFDFAGWNTKADGSGTTFKTEQDVCNSLLELAEELSKKDPNATLHLYAQWTPIKYTIKFNSNGGTTSVMSDLLMTYGVAKDLTKNTFTNPDGYYVNWNTKADGTGTSYTDGQSVINMTDVSNNVITLYAQWSHPKVTYINNQGTFKDGKAEHTLTYLHSVTKVESDAVYEEPTRTNYAFAGWNTKADGSGTAYATETDVCKNLPTVAEKEPQHTIKLYAQWTWIAVTFHAESNSGKGKFEDGSTVNYIVFHKNGTTYENNDQAYKVPSLDSDTLVFGGWTTNADGTGTVYKTQSAVPKAPNAKGEYPVYYAKYVIGHKITYHSNLHDGMQYQDGDEESEHTHVESVPSETSRNGETYVQTVPEGDTVKVADNGFSWDAIVTKAKEILKTLFHLND